MKTTKPEKTADAAVGAKARYVMVGGFLGAGKTTAISRLAKYWSDAARRVGLITNDQGKELVDTAMLRSHGYATEEISGGCFCCRFNSLVDAAEKLSAQTRPDVFIAEPVGSCTDLVATVSYPLRRIYGQDFSIAPLSVLVDPVRAARIFGLEPGKSFSEKVAYIYRKQLEEADLIVINKCDAVLPGKVSELRATLAQQFSKAEIFMVSARDETGMRAWFDRLNTGEAGTRAAMEIDYGIYAEGEALLGWLNATVQISARDEFDGNLFLRRLAGEMQSALSGGGAEVAHLKMTLDPGGALGDLAVINLVRNDFVPELSQELADPLDAGELIVNIRAEVPAEILRDVLEQSLAAAAASDPGITTVVEHLEFFQPGKPEPTHRFTTG